MFRLSYLTTFICFSMLSIAMGQDRAGTEIKIAFWNVENLFDDQRDTNSPDEDLFVPTALNEKLRKDAEIIRYLDADIIGLMEVENRTILKRLVDERLSEMGYRYHALIDEPNDRGIDCALLSRRPFLCYSYDVPDFYRGILTARFAHNGNPFYVIVNHWKSRFGGGAEQRMNCSQQVIDLVENIIPQFEGTKEIPMIIGGDFNDNDTDPSVVYLEKKGLTNTLKSIALNDRWTLLYDNRDLGIVELDSFDHIFVNNNCLTGNTLRWKTSQVVRPEMMLGRRTIRGKEHLWPIDDHQNRIGYSDHFPVVTTVELGP